MTIHWKKNIKYLQASALSVAIGATTLLLAAWPSSCSKGPSNQGGSELLSRARPKGSLKGYQAIDDQLSQSIAVTGRAGNVDSLSNSVLGAHLPAGVTAENANELLGGWVGGETLGGTPSRFVGGVPGPVNMFLWTLVLRSLASEIAQLCEDNPVSAGVASKYLPEFRKDLKDWCTAKSPESFDAVWVWIQGFESESERVEVAKAIAPHIGTLSAADVIFVMMMNPHFLLEK
jgi:hypothetical protein